MKKQFKSIVSVVLSAAMVVALGSGLEGNTKSAKAFGYDLTEEEQITMSLKQNNSKIFEPTAEHMDDGILAEVKLTQSGIYTLTVEAVDDYEDIGGNEDIKYIGLETGLTALPETLDIKTKTLSVKHFAADGSATVNHYAWNAELYPDGNKEGNELRFGVANNYVSRTNSKQSEEFGKANPFMTNVNGTWTSTEAIDVRSGDLVSFTFEVSTKNEPENWEEEHPYAYETPEALLGQEGVKRTPTPATPAPATPTPNMNANKYNAYIGFQTDTYLFRDAWDAKETGLKQTKYPKYNYKKQIGISLGDDEYADATLKDAEITKNGTYTVSMEGPNLQTLKGKAADSKASTSFNMLFISTDIPLAMKGVTATNVSLKMDGKVIKSGMTIKTKPDAEGYYQLMVADAYTEAYASDAEINAVPYTKDAKALKTLPAKSMEITFTLSGINFNQDFSKKVIGPKKGKTFTKGDFKYKVTKAATETAGKKKQGQVTVVGLAKSGKTAKSLTVGATVKKTGTYKVTKLNANAFKGAKAASITLGKNVKSIPANAFANCKKLTKLNLKAKLSSVNKKAFSGCTKSITVSGTAKKANVKKIQKVYNKAK